MPITVGERLPEATFKTQSADGPANITVSDVFAAKKVVLFAVPGAFTPTCSMNHLPGYLEHYETILSMGGNVLPSYPFSRKFLKVERCLRSRTSGRTVPDLTRWSSSNLLAATTASRSVSDFLRQMSDTSLSMSEAFRP